MKIMCERCEVEPATKFYRNYLGPHAVCDDCHEFVDRVSHKTISSSADEYLEEVVIDQIMEG